MRPLNSFSIYVSKINSLARLLLIGRTYRLDRVCIGIDDAKNVEEHDDDGLLLTTDCESWIMKMLSLRILMPLKRCPGASTFI